MKDFNEYPKTIKKTARYILQDVSDINKLEEIQQMINQCINKKKQELTNESR
ncbi:hypothetical protein LGQ02_19490 [Bacillus shivajii]|uniref:hypothetical protein n=1 Tax=Bacillus shivajii TaxID=1983719 RepID=UPI001CF94CBC|nr:hypothetical protein [Bacillus shivajii]UCZ52938.1 hypothetical protein LGQ02_19490 [Bacillus shivajii]